MQTMLDTAGQIVGQRAKAEKLDPNTTEITLEWNTKDGPEKYMPTWGGWAPRPPDTPKADIHFNISLAGGQAPAKDGKYTFSVPGRR